jgi:hypothetical protein
LRGRHEHKDDFYIALVGNGENGATPSRRSVPVRVTMLPQVTKMQRVHLQTLNLRKAHIS